ncbi:LacI family DNA-binding transcriptional regulator [Deinococcus sp. KNUC1210]|uniref:LacI family DNA-binding transcriptional regulator n=1 Tax=Deinococcus sp. KNUC1210 TaxID=2917691 RepID=UPI00351D932B
MTTNITLDEVARAAGVSVSTASRVISGAVRVAPNKREAVLQAVRDLGYRTNLIARGLASGRSMSVGILTQDISSPYYGEVLRGIEDGLEGSGYSPLFVSGHWRVEEEASALDTLLGRPVDAMIILGGHTPDERLIQIAERLPLMAVGRNIRGLEDNCLRVDNVQGACSVVQHLLELGHHRIAYIGGPTSHRDASDRLQGYRQALEERRAGLRRGTGHRG